MAKEEVPELCKGCRRAVFFTDPNEEECWYYWEGKKHCTQYSP